MLKVVIMTSGTGGTAVICLPELVRVRNVRVVGVVRAHGLNPRTRARRLRAKFRKIFRIGVLGALNGIRMRKWFVTSHPSLEAVCAAASVSLYDVPYIGSDDTVAVLRSLDADFGISLGNGFIPTSVFSLPHYGMVNLHGERLPEYQNAQSVIWPIYNSERVTGLTIHQIAEGIDEGAILYQETFPIKFRPTLEATVRATLVDTRDRTPKAVAHVCANFHHLRETAAKQRDGCRYTTPSFRQFLRMRRNNSRLCRA